MESKNNDRYPTQAGLAVLIIALLLAAPANASTGVCPVCPMGFDCSTGTPVVGGADGQILIRENGVMVWKNIAEVAAQGPQGATGATGPQGPKGPQG